LTPLFTETVQSVTVNPYWNIPETIARKEILPRARRNPGYLRARYFVRDGKLRQPPGPRNALGRVKLEMPNPFNSYLHDTPSRSLFASNERHLSHGCMRVELIRQLASFALTGSPDAAIERVNGAIATGKNMGLALDAPMPVHVLYWTAIADANGEVRFVPDIYGRDAALTAALAGQRTSGQVAANL